MGREPPIEKRSTVGREPPIEKGSTVGRELPIELLGMIWPLPRKKESFSGKEAYQWAGSCSLGRELPS